MKVLETHKQVLVFVGRRPSTALDESESNFKRIVFVALPFFGLICVTCYATSTAIFILQLISVSLEETVSAFLQVAGSIYLIYAIIVALFIRRKLNRIFTKLTELYKKCECNLISKISYILFRL